MIDLAADAATFGADFGETVVYRPAAGGSRSITNANVIRQEAEVLAMTPEGQATPSLLVIVPNSVTAGIARSELDLGGDLIDVAVKSGGARSSRKMAFIVNEDEGLLTLAVR